MFTLYVLHASHTDLGYTDIQEKMQAHHVAFIREALEMTRRFPGFVWNCESYLCVESFLKSAAAAEKRAFIQAVQAGAMGLSGSYFNLTDLIPAQVQNEVMDRCRAQWRQLGLNVRSAMTADINGYSWGFADVLYDHGVTRLLSSIHTHHGYYPLMLKQQPFWWETPKGHKLLAWNGDHYNLGNELGIAMTPSFEYTVRDGLTGAAMTDAQRADARIRAYVDSLLRADYPYDFAPVCVSSDMTDNAPPSPAVWRFVSAFNERHRDIQLKMTTLDAFFDAVEAADKPIPVYRGDWTDWWADGVGSTPDDVMEYRRAARSYSLCRKADRDGILGGRENYASALQNLMLYGEHTWGYSSSITEPCHPQVNHLRQRKRLFALKAGESADIARERVQQALGETAVSADKEMYFRAVNVHDVPVQDMLAVDVEQFYGHRCFRVVDTATGADVPFQLSRYSRGPEMCIWLDMRPGESKTFSLRETSEKSLASAGRSAERGIEGVDDLKWHLDSQANGQGGVSPFAMDSPWMHVAFEYGRGIASIQDKRTGREWTAQGEETGAFTPVYEVTRPRPGQDMAAVRREMGRNRKAFRTQRTLGVLTDVQPLENGPLFARAALTYDLPGCTLCQIILTLYKRIPRLGIDLRLHKENEWAPENVYLSLPFERDTEIWLDKAGAVMRPRIDQLPFTCGDFYAVQNGVAFAGDTCSLLVACPDAPLVAMGGLAAHPVRLSGEEEFGQERVYSWVMNNFWETNFNACLAGCYQFHYDLLLTDKTAPAELFRLAETINEGVFQFYRFEGARKIPIGGKEESL